MFPFELDKFAEKKAVGWRCANCWRMKNKDISTLCHIYLKLAYFLTLFVVLLMFVLTFIIFAFEKTTSISTVISIK